MSLQVGFHFINLPNDECVECYKNSLSTANYDALVFKLSSELLHRNNAIDTFHMC